jgi:hypothetical protein
MFSLADARTRPAPPIHPTAKITALSLTIHAGAVAMTPNEK